MPHRPVRFRWRRSFPVPVGRIWQLFSDTDRMDQAVGLPATTFRQVTLPNGRTVLEAHATFLGMRFKWIELPYEWAVERWFTVERVFDHALLVRAIRTGATFTPRGPDETEVEVQAAFVPRTLLGSLFIRLVVGCIFLPRLAHVYRQVVANDLQHQAEPYPALPHSAVAEAQLLPVVEQLRRQPVMDRLVDRLVAHIREAEDRDVIRMRPFVLADRWGADRIDVLRLCLYATHAGLLDVSWDVLCPSCRVAKVSLGSLAQLRPEMHCDVCHIAYDANFDEYVELRFSVNRAIRVAEAPTFCIAGPGNLRHILGQIRVPPRSSAALTLPFEPGDFHLRTPGTTERGTIHVSDAGSAEASIRYHDGGLSPLQLSLQPGRRTLHAINASDQEVLLLVEQDAWGTQGASAALVTALHDFRRLFSSEILAPGTSAAIRSLTILFSDLKGSTRLYVEGGDTAAYAQVRDHVRILTQVIADHQGALVKTIGDAVMAVFTRARDGADAGLDILTAIAAFNARHPRRPPLSIKLGLHCGACIAIGANNTLDYFGTTVNLAARLHAQSRGGELVVTNAVIDDPGVREIVDRRGITPERFEQMLPGFDRPFQLYRLRGG